jgi:hypothetical protein
MKLVNIKKIYFGGRKRLEQWYSLLSTESSNPSYLMEPTNIKKIHFGGWKWLERRPFLSSPKPDNPSL